MAASEISLISKFQGCLIGLAVGDALGAPVEGMAGAQIGRKYGKVNRMLGGGWHALPPGGYTDDTAMMLCIARSIVQKRIFDPDDVASKFLRWFNGDPIGIGRTTWIALSEIKAGAAWNEAGKIAHEKLDGKSAGNGSIMRCAPIGLLHFKNYDKLVRDSIDSSIITHWDPQAGWGCVAVNLAIAELLFDRKDDLLSKIGENIDQPEVKRTITRVGKIESLRREPSAYVLDTLQAAFWCFLNTASFEDAVVTAVNLGGDTDTVGAVCGALAGAYYGFEAIPERWHEVLQDRDEILELGQKIYELTDA